MEIKLKGFIFLLKNWKLVIHLLLHTRTFGVNNKSTSQFDSFLSTHNRGLKHIKENYKAAKVRAKCGFLTEEECKNLGW